VHGAVSGAQSPGCEGMIRTGIKEPIAKASSPDATRQPDDVVKL
jgi:hypothetical protein